MSMIPERNINSIGTDLKSMDSTFMDRFKRADLLASVFFIFKTLKNQTLITFQFSLQPKLTLITYLLKIHY
jgi:hypothetical protein